MGPGDTASLRMPWPPSARDAKQSIRMTADRLLLLPVRRRRRPQEPRRHPHPGDRQPQPPPGVGRGGRGRARRYGTSRRATTCSSRPTRASRWRSAARSTSSSASATCTRSRRCARTARPGCTCTSSRLRSAVRLGHGVRLLSLRPALGFARPFGFVLIVTGTAAGWRTGGNVVGRRRGRRGSPTTDRWRLLAEHLAQLGLHRRDRPARVPVNASGASVHHHAKSSPPSPQPSRPNSVSVETTVPSSCSSSIRRSGSCQHTSGFRSAWWRPVRSACRCSAQPGPAANPGRFRKMHASFTSRVRHSVVLARLLLARP